MKLKNKLLMPILGFSTLASTLTPCLTACAKNDTNVVGYTVVNNTIYGLNKSGNKIKLSDEQLESLSGGFLVTMADGTYTYVDKSGHAEGSDHPWPNTIAGFIDRASELKVWDYEIFLTGGEYELTSVKQETPASYFFIHGVTNYEGKLLSILDAVPGEDTTDTKKDSISLGGLSKLSIDHLLVKGSKYASNGHNWSITDCEDFEFSYCQLWGKNIFKGKKDIFNCCKIDSSVIEWQQTTETANPYKSDYGIWLYDVQYAYFQHCNFVSCGKAVKINTPTKATLGVKFGFNDCNFKIDSVKGIPNQEGTDRSKWGDQNKRAVDACDTNFTSEQPLLIYYNNIIGDIDTSTDLQNVEKGMHWGFVGSNDTTQWTPEGEGCKHIVKEGQLPE